MIILGPSCCREKIEEMVEFQKPVDYSRAIVFKNLLIIPRPLFSKPVDYSRAIVEEEVGAGGPQTREQLVGGLEGCNLQSDLHLDLCICICICIYITLLHCVCGEHEEIRHRYVTKYGIRTKQIWLKKLRISSSVLSEVIQLSVEDNFKGRDNVAK